jgi:hypothetical protein
MSMNAIVRTMRRLALLAALAGLLWSCQGQDRDHGSLATSDIPDQEFSDFTTQESDSGLVRWILKAPVARVYNARRLLVTDDPRRASSGSTASARSIRKTS